ncbi:hypothetical protein [Cytobacillus sp. IB215665]|uniref:hypothetical protein n=1 Tax=Cytobacillus sp. IB215665 TaxID=3097357 RepID=UPI002A1036B6|nr:hypothetical protein [Cytobacillus sp. IB215665]MDX8366109.1 hypothetical protein [Cytobacillus sp. IB215665]
MYGKDKDCKCRVVPPPPQGPQGPPGKPGPPGPPGPPGSTSLITTVKQCVGFELPTAPIPFPFDVEIRNVMGTPMFQFFNFSVIQLDGANYGFLSDNGAPRLAANGVIMNYNTPGVFAGMVSVNGPAGVISIENPGNNYQLSFSTQVMLQSGQSVEFVIRQNGMAIPESEIQVTI